MAGKELLCRLHRGFWPGPGWLLCDTQGLGSQGGDPYGCVVPEKNLQTKLPRAQRSAEAHQSQQVQREGSTAITPFIQWAFLEDPPPKGFNYLK